MEQENTYYATGRRKTAIARTWIKPGNGEIVINDRPVEDYFKVDSAQAQLQQPFALTKPHRPAEPKRHRESLEPARELSSGSSSS